jgi:hypothetical protein
VGGLFAGFFLLSLPPPPPPPPRPYQIDGTGFVQPPYCPYFQAGRVYRAWHQLLESCCNGWCEALCIPRGAPQSSHSRLSQLAAAGAWLHQIHRQACARFCLLQYVHNGVSGVPAWQCHGIITPRVSMRLGRHRHSPSTACAGATPSWFSSWCPLPCSRLMLVGVVYLALLANLV